MCQHMIITFVPTSDFVLFYNIQKEKENILF